MRVSNRSDFAGASWQPYQEVIPWLLAPVGGQATVFAQFMDKAGNESAVYTDEVEVQNAILIGLLKGLVTVKLPPMNLQPQAGAAGVYVGVVGQSDIPPTFTDAGGAFTLPDLPPGNYTLRFELTGFASQERAVTVKAGETTDVGEVTLGAAGQTFLPVLMR